MTLDEFFAALEKTPRDWRVDGYGHWPSRRGTLRRKGAFALQCPITAVAEFGERQGVWTYAGPYLWRAAAREIGLQVADAQKIVSGSDERGSLRGRLLAACGIAEPRG